MGKFNDARIIRESDDGTGVSLPFVNGFVSKAWYAEMCQAEEEFETTGRCDHPDWYNVGLTDQKCHVCGAILPPGH